MRGKMKLGILIAKVFSVGDWNIATETKIETPK